MNYIDKKYADAINPYINGTAHNCSYCDRIEELILLDGQYNYITLAIGQIAEGYLQLCTKKHRTSMTGLMNFETEEFIKMKRVIKKAMKIVYGTNGICFEHGQAGVYHWEQNAEKNLRTLCYHAHLHFLPVDIDIRESIMKCLPEYHTAKDIWEVKGIREEILSAGPYLYFEDVNEVGYVFPVDDESKVPRQFLRTCVATAVGVKERADWISVPGTELFELGKKKLKPILEELWSYECND